MKKISAISFFLCIILIMVFMAGCGSEPIAIKGVDKLQPSAEKYPNIILITVSSLRADHTGCLGYQRDTTTNFDIFASRCTLFTQAFSTSSWQMPAAGSIFTSLYPSQHNATHISRKLDPNVPTMAEILKDEGFYTAGFLCNPRLTSEFGFERGFDLYDDFSVNMMLSTLMPEQAEAIDINKQRTNDLVNDAAIRWLTNNSHKPFFLFVHYYDTHWDYLPRPPYDTLYNPDYTGTIEGANISKEPLYSNEPSKQDVEQIIALYDGEIKQSDNDLGELLGYLKSQGRFDDSIIIVMGDHGEQFYEHGNTSHHGLYDEMLHIPLAIMVQWNNQPQRIDSLVSATDILPTVLDFINVDKPSQCKGQSLRPVIEKKESQPREYIFAEYSGGAIPDCAAVRFENFKFMKQEGEIFAYDLKEDRLEHKTIYRKDFTDEMNKLYDSVKDLLVAD